MDDAQIDTKKLIGGEGKEDPEVLV